MNYYEVSIGVEKHWDSSIFTYSYEGVLAPGSLVNAPFGRKNKVGFVIKKVSKPTFAAKSLSPYDEVSISKNTRNFLDWFRQYYAARGGQATAQFLPHYLTKKVPKATQKKATNIEDIQLNERQNTAVQQITETPKPSVLHGITGSGKTRVYISLILNTLQQGRSALLLYPEISLTPQLISEIERYAPVAVFHSGLTNAQRSRLWFQVTTSTEPMVVAGPRSALFLPYTDLGLIVIDEAHESTYKQESDIRYNGVLAAGGLAKAHEAKLVIASATPPVTETELILGSGGSLTCMHDQAITNSHEKSVEIIDRKDRSMFSKHPLISDQLLVSIQTALAHEKQALLFINRRGTARLTLCENCGWQAECPDCELPLTYHHDQHKLVCHTCGRTAMVEPLCPSCSHKTSLKALGSKAIVDEVQRLFPGARIARFDTDTDKDESFHTTYEAVKKGDVDILIGTQQIAKGLDLPLLEVIGVLDADLSLHFPDYSSDERTFQLVSQVSGRVGRGHGNGKIFVQTFHSGNKVIDLATREDWHTFRKIELQNRETHNFPPFVHAAKIIFRDKNMQKAFKRAETTKETLEKEIGSIDGPLPAFHQKKSGHYYVHLHLKSNSRSAILKAIQALKDDVILDLDPTSFL